MFEKSPVFQGAAPFEQLLKATMATSGAPGVCFFFYCPRFARLGGDADRKIESPPYSPFSTFMFGGLDCGATEFRSVILFLPRWF